MKRLAVLIWAALLAPALTPAAAQEGPDSLPPGPHRDETFYFCAACHGVTVISRQGMSRERWDATLHWMTEKHAMPVLEGEDRTLILDYLAQAFPQAAPAGGRGAWQNPFEPR